MTIFILKDSMDTPKDNPEGYKDGSALTYVKNYKGKLFLYHGDMDDNVHMQNSIYLISKLQDEGKTFDSCFIPVDVMAGEDQKQFI